MFYETYLRGYLEKREPKNSYDKSINKTFDFLKQYCYVPLNYEVHCPVILNKNKVLLLSDVAEKFKKEDAGILIRSTYFNIFSERLHVWREHEFVEDTKIHTDTWQEPNETGCISTSDDCDNIIKKIEEMYPNKSRWEK